MSSLTRQTYPHEVINFITINYVKENLNRLPLLNWHGTEKAKCLECELRSQLKNLAVESNSTPRITRGV